MRQEGNSIDNIENKIYKWLSIKNVTILVVMFLVFILIPIFLCSFVNRATGDDYGYAIATRMIWNSTKSLPLLLKASWNTIKEYYYSWQGTWFSIFLFTLQPEVFSKDGYVIVAFLMIFLWIFSTWILGKRILEEIGITNWGKTILISIYLIVNISFIPSTKSSIFWYNGCSHYMVPFVMCQCGCYFLLQWGKEYSLRYFLGIVVIMSLLGGANYQAALMILIITVYYMIGHYYVKKNVKTLLLLIPCMLEIIGLIISMKAPGNKVRGGEEFGFSIQKVMQVIGKSFVESIKDVALYLREKPLIFVLMMACFIIALEVMHNREEKVTIKHPVWIGIASVCLYCAMQAPALYAEVSVSGGVYNMNFQTCMLMFFVIIILLANSLEGKINNKKEFTNDKLHKRIWVWGLGICFILVIWCRSDIKETTTWKCIDYIVSGQAEDFYKQMEIQTELMTQENVQDVVIPFVNDFQGPLMHMPVTEDSRKWTNYVTAKFYGKNSVVAIKRDEWERRYR